MYFWVGILFFSLFIPLIMICFGWRFMKNPPENYDKLMVYRTNRSMQNEATWSFAHCYIGKLFFIFGIIMSIFIIVVMFRFKDKAPDFIGFVGGVFNSIEFIFLSAFIISTERALSKTFDSKGNRKNNI